MFCQHGKTKHRGGTSWHLHWDAHQNLHCEDHKVQFALLLQIGGVEIHLCIVDSGTDSHVGGLQGWLPLVDLNEPASFM